MKYWRRLDNAAKIFPSASSGHDTNVFRFYCELKEEVDHKYLQDALDKTIGQFPIFSSVMKKGLFWYYLEDSNIKPVVEKESRRPCSRLYDKDVKRLLFKVTYYEKRINLDVYHVLTDGTGAQEFLKALVSNYLLLKYELDSKDINIDFDASNYQKADDSYKKFYEKDKKKNNKGRKAYKIKASKTSNREIKIIEGTMPSNMVLDKARSYNVTITAFLTGILLKAIFEEMAVSDIKKPVVVSVPVNLRKYFDSASARNFFGVIFISYDFSKMSCELEDIVKYVNEVLKKELDKDKVKFRMNALIGVEKNAVIRAVPLVIKNIVLNIAFRISETFETTTVSNIGKISMSEIFSEYINSFGMFVTTNKIQAGICTYNDVLTVSFSSCFINSDIERRFFRALTDIDIPVTISANEVSE